MQDLGADSPYLYCNRTQKFQYLGTIYRYKTSGINNTITNNYHHCPFKFEIDYNEIKVKLLLELSFHP